MPRINMDEFEIKNKEYFNNIAKSKRGDYQLEKNSNRLSTYIQNKNRKIIINSINFKESILDIGCGNGEFTNELNKLAKTTAIDISEEMIKIAKKTFPNINFVASSMYSIPFQEKTFDTTVCLNTLHHIKNIETAIREICRVTKNQILIEIKNKKSINYLRRKLMKNQEYSWKASTTKEINEIFNKCNFKLYRKHNIIPLLNPVYILDFRRI